MNVGEGDAADKVVRLMLTGGEVAVRLTGSMLKNGVVMLLALYKNHKKVYGKTRLVKLLNHTRDIRAFTMTPEQFRLFKRQCLRYKILYSAVRDKRRRNALVDVILPVTEIERANRIFENIRYVPDGDQQTRSKQEPVKKKEPRSGRGSRDTRDNFYTRGSAQKTTSEKPSVEEQLKGYKAQQQKKSNQARTRTKTKSKGRVK